jgi:dTDP-4-dehydrorhamnose 3,5-epimerase
MSLKVSDIVRDLAISGVGNHTQATSRRESCSRMGSLISISAALRAIASPGQLLGLSRRRASPPVEHRLHFAELLNSQAKCVTCLQGSRIRRGVDLRMGSPTVGRWAGLRGRGCRS